MKRLRNKTDSDLGLSGYEVAARSEMDIPESIALAAVNQNPSMFEIVEDEPEEQEKPKASHRQHYFRKDGTCRCGAIEEN